MKKISFTLQRAEDLIFLNEPDLKLYQQQDGETLEYPIADIESTQEEVLFAAPEDMGGLWQHIKEEFHKMFAPIRASGGTSTIGLLSIAFAFMQYMFSLNTPFARGWRLDVVRRMGLNLEQKVPGVSMNALFKYFKKGAALIIMRFIYFLPYLIFLFVSSLSLIHI